MNFNQNQSTDEENLYYYQGGRVMRLPLAEGGGPSQITADLLDIRHLPISSGETLYFVDKIEEKASVPACTNNWMIRSVAKDGASSPDNLSGKLECPGGLAADDDALYWYNFTDSLIMKMTKPLSE